MSTEDLVVVGSVCLGQNPQLMVILVTADGITPPIWFGQGSDPEILGVVTTRCAPLARPALCRTTPYRLHPSRSPAPGGAASGRTGPIPGAGQSPKSVPQNSG